MATGTQPLSDQHGTRTSHRDREEREQLPQTLRRGDGHPPAGSIAKNTSMR